MASNLKYPVALKNTRLDDITTRAGNAALLRIYSGTQPANADTALSGNTLLAELVCGSPFAGSAASGVLTVTNPTNDTSADATGTASFFRLVKSDGTTVVMDGSVSTSGADLNLNTVSITSGGTVSVTSWTITSAN